MDFRDFHLPQLQMDMSRSSRGVGWANGCCHIVFSTRAVPVFFFLGEHLKVLGAGTKILGRVENF